MARCPTCQADFDKGEQFCPKDGSPLSPAPSARDLLLGRVLGGRYRLIDRLGQGGMGTVYRAVHTLMDKPVAIKILRGELATDAEAVARFHREARSASRLDHDHCIRVTDFGQTDDRLLYLAMELLEGRSLGERLRAGPLPVSEAAQIAHAVALALEHAHEAGVIHRDLKPDNVFLALRSRGRESVKVLDFGLAKLASDSGQSRSITRDGTIFGTPAYMAPEQAQGEPLDPRTDLYALGVLLYHMLTGRLPFEAETFVALLTKQVREAPRPPRDLDPSIPAELDAIVLRCMQKRADQRFPTATALAEALAPFVASGAMATETSTNPVRAHGAAETSGGFDSSELSVPRRRRTPLVWMLGGALALAGLVGASLRRPAPTSAVEGLSELDEIRRLVDRGQLDEAAEQLEVLHRKGETAALERATGEVAERRGHRLEALAHLHRAKTLAPTDAAVRTALAALLLRFDQKIDGCRQAERALALASARPAGPTTDERTTIGLVRGMLSGAGCPTPPEAR